MTSGYDWPRGFDRTHPENREPYPHGFRVGVREAFENILTQLERLGAEDVTIQTNASHQTRNPNLPYSDADPEDPSIVVRYTYQGSRYAIPCDRWDNLRDNAQAVAKYVDAKRALNRYGVETRSTEWETQIIESGSDAGSTGGSTTSPDTPGQPTGTGTGGGSGGSDEIGSTDTEVFAGGSPDSCPDCGADVPDLGDVQFCTECGAELDR